MPTKAELIRLHADPKPFHYCDDCVAKKTRNAPRLLQEIQKCAGCKKIILCSSYTKKELSRIVKHREKPPIHPAIKYNIRRFKGGKNAGMAAPNSVQS